MNPPIFVIGNPRSGTTLLRLMLTCHHNICIPPECGWLVGMYPKYRKSIFDKDTIDSLLVDLQNPSTKKFETWNINIANLRENLLHLVASGLNTYSSVSNEIYLHYLGTYQKSKRRWGDKNNFYLHHIDTINDLFPDSLFIHIVRDGRDVACSYRSLKNIKGKYAPNLPTAISNIAWRWKGNLDIIENTLNKLDYRRAFIIRYEDLVTNPVTQLESLCQFLNEPFDHQMLEFNNENIIKKLEPDETMPWKKLTKQPLTNRRVGRWRTELSANDIQQFEFIARDKLIRYGYI